WCRSSARAARSQVPSSPLTSPGRATSPPTARCCGRWRCRPRTGPSRSTSATSATAVPSPPSSSTTRHPGGARRCPRTRTSAAVRSRCASPPTSWAWRSSGRCGARSSRSTASRRRRRSSRSA
ncbi:MAG: hypothetical protein AVDCRST_MAG34-1903, partial [uncultured Nocardioidaceae bacterium]